MTRPQAERWVTAACGEWRRAAARAPQTPHGGNPEVSWSRGAAFTAPKEGLWALKKKAGPGPEQSAQPEPVQPAVPEPPAGPPSADPPAVADGPDRHQNPT